MLVPIILSGGSGSRLWPLSRESYPKQFLPLINESTLLQNTLKRLRFIEEISAPIIVCAANSQFIILEQLKQIGIEPLAVIVEPCRRNTATAISLAAHYLAEHFPHANMLILPADHDIKDEKLFCREVMYANTHIENDQLLTFGIRPLRPETNYGYIHVSEQDNDAHFLPVKQFIEKPNFRHAQEYYSADNYYWNSGIFLFPVQAFLQEFMTHANTIAMNSKIALQKARIETHYIYPDQEVLEASESISIDYALMEKTEKTIMLPLTIRWSDLGNWESLINNLPTDEKNNIIKGDVQLSDVSNSYIQASERMIAAIGLDNMVVVDSGDTLLVMDRNKGNLMRAFYQQLTEKKRSEAILPYIVHRPWGTYQTVYEESQFLLKKITVNPGQQLSLQLHHHRAEHWTIVKGIATVTVDDKTMDLQRDQSVYIPLKAQHRISNNTQEILEIVEVQIGDHLSEDDIVRLQDDYGR